MILEVIQYIILVSIPIFLYLKIIPRKYTIRTLFLSLILILAFVLLNNYSLFDLGFRTDNFSYLWKTYLLLTLTMLSVVLIYSKFHGYTIGKRIKREVHFRRLKFIPISISQEIIFRGFLVALLASIHNSIGFVVLFNTALFLLIHSFYKDFKKFWIILAVGNIAYTSFYYIYPNIYLMILSHIVLNFIATAYGWLGDRDG